MTRSLFIALVGCAALAACGSSGPAPEAATGGAALDQSAPAEKSPATEAAPDFTLGAVDGSSVSLASYRGKTVVLEWFNPGCPFVKYAHGEGPLGDIAAKQIADGVVWLAINSGAQGKQGNGVELNRDAATKWSMSYPILMDEDGSVGRAYGAKTTPHMFIIAADGSLAYRGALDNAPFGKPTNGDTVVNYVEAALSDIAGGREVAVRETQSYGCSVKYASN